VNYLKKITPDTDGQLHIPSGWRIIAWLGLDADGQVCVVASDGATPNPFEPGT
jgi:hypothetical protein